MQRFYKTKSFYKRCNSSKILIIRGSLKIKNALTFILVLWVLIPYHLIKPKKLRVIPENILQRFLAKYESGIS